MLVLTRKEGETIYIGDNLIITVTEIQPGKIRLGIEAPKTVRVMRGELLTEEQQQAITEKAHAVSG